MSMECTLIISNQTILSIMKSIFVLLVLALMVVSCNDSCGNKSEEVPVEQIDTISVDTVKPVE